MGCLRNHLGKALKILLLFRFAVLSMGGFLPLRLPDIWRQVITLGVSMRYWSRWVLEAGATHRVLPAVLDSGDAQGIMPMEFPVLNFITAPCFAAGPHLGRGFAILMYHLIVFGLSFLNARIWKEKRIAGIDASLAMLLLPIFSVGLVWSGKYMPDYLSVLLVCMAIGLSWTQERFFRSFALATLGMLMKPTAIIVFFIYLLHDQLRKTSWIRKAFSAGLWILPAVIVVYLYYTLGIQALSQFQDRSSTIGVEPRSFSKGAMEFLHHLPFVFTFYFKKAFFWGGGGVILGIYLIQSFFRSIPWALWGVSFLQFFSLSILDGGYLFYDHHYYLLALLPILCLLFIDALNRCRHPLLFFGMILGLSLPILEVSSMDLKTLYHIPKEPLWTLDQQVRDLKVRNPDFPWREGKPFRSSVESFPFLGLIFGEISGSHRAHYGFFYRGDALPSECEAVDHSESITLVKCH